MNEYNIRWPFSGWFWLHCAMSVALTLFVAHLQSLQATTMLAILAYMHVATRSAASNEASRQKEKREKMDKIRTDAS